MTNTMERLPKSNPMSKLISPLAHARKLNELDSNYVQRPASLAKVLSAENIIEGSSKHTTETNFNHLQKMQVGGDDSMAPGETNSGMTQSPFQKRKESTLNMLEKWFPNGSKGRDTSMVKRVAQQIKTVEFDTEFPVVSNKTDDSKFSDLPASLTVGPSSLSPHPRAMSFGNSVNRAAAMSRTRY